MALPSKNKNGVYQTRIVVPKPLQSIVGLSELKKSLGTKDEAEALARHIDVHARFKNIIAKARLSLKTNELLNESVLTEVVDSCRGNQATRAVTTPEFFAGTTTFLNNDVEFGDVSDGNSYIFEGESEIERVLAEDCSDAVFICPNVDVIELIVDDIVNLHKAFQENGKYNEERFYKYFEQLHGVLGEIVEPELSVRGIEPSIRSQRYRKLLLLVAKNHVLISNAAVRRYQSRIELTQLGAEIDVVSQSPEREISINLGDLWDEYKSALHRRMPDVAEKRLRDYSAPIHKFLSLYGSADVSELTKRDVMEFRNVLERLPTRPKKEIAALGLLEQVAKAAELGLPTTSQSSVKTQMQAISALLTHAVTEGYIEINPVHGSTTNISKVVIHDEDKSYNSTEIKAIFESGIFRNNDKPKKANYGQAHYWIPLMLYYSGARAEEIAQLYVDDVRLDAEIPHIKITDEKPDQSLKNNCRRDVPIHQHILDLGFEDYVRGLPTSGRLFPELSKSKGGGYHAKVSLWFGRYLKSELKIERRGLKPFHGFRHSFITACRERGERQDVQFAVTGHRQKDVGSEYGFCSLEVKNRLVQSVPRCFQ